MVDKNEWTVAKSASKTNYLIKSGFKCRCRYGNRFAYLAYEMNHFFRHIRATAEKTQRYVQMTQRTHSSL